MARYGDNNPNLRGQDSPGNLRLTPNCESGNHTCSYSLSGMGIDPVTNQPYNYYVWEHVSSPVTGGHSVGTNDYITPGPAGSPEANQFGQDQLGGTALDTYRFFTISASPIYDPSKQVPVMIQEQGTTIGYEHIYSTGGDVYINGSTHLQ